MTRRDKIIEMFTASPFGANVELSCNDIVKTFIANQEPTSSNHGYRYLSGSISSVLKKLVDEGTLMYSTNTTPRGGYLYKLKTDIND